MIGLGLVAIEAALLPGGGPIGETGVGATREAPLDREAATPRPFRLGAADTEGEGPIGALRPMTGEMWATGCC